MVWGTKASLVDGRPIHYLVLASGIRGVATFEIPPGIDENELYNIMIKRLPPADDYFANRES